MFVFFGKNLASLKKITTRSYYYSNGVVLYMGMSDGPHKANLQVDKEHLAYFDHNDKELGTVVYQNDNGTFFDAAGVKIGFSRKQEYGYIFYDRYEKWIGTSKNFRGDGKTITHYYDIEGTMIGCEIPSESTIWSYEFKLSNFKFTYVEELEKKKKEKEEVKEKTDSSTNLAINNTKTLNNAAVSSYAFRIKDLKSTVPPLMLTPQSHKEKNKQTVKQKPAQKKLLLSRVDFFKTSKINNKWQPHQRCMTALVSLGHDLFASGSQDQTIKIWNAQGSCLQTLKGHSGAIRCLMRLKTGCLVSGSDDGTIKIWEKTRLSKAEVFECKKTLLFKGIVDFATFPDGFFVAASGDGTISVFDKNGIELFRQEDNDDIRIIRVYENNYLIVSDGNNIRKLEWNRQTNQLSDVTDAFSYLGHDSVITTLTMLSNNLIGGTKNGTIKIWDSKGICTQTLKEHMDSILSVVVLSQKLFVSGSRDGLIKLWEFSEHWKCIHTLKADLGSVEFLIALSEEKLITGNGYQIISRGQEEFSSGNTMWFPMFCRG